VYDHLLTVWRVQSAETATDYTTALSDLKAKYGDAVAKYISDIDPALWTVSADMPSANMPSAPTLAQPAPLAALADEPSRPLTAAGAPALPLPTFTPSATTGFDTDGSDAVLPAPLPCPLFVWRTTNFVESANNTDRKSSV
jgi:hypothetical protein